MKFSASITIYRINFVSVLMNQLKCNFMERRMTFVTLSTKKFFQSVSILIVKEIAPVGESIILRN